MLVKKAVTNGPIHDLLASRWSCRAFQKDKPVSRKDIISVCEAGRWAPSCFGDEPWRFLVWDRNHDEENWKKAFDCLVKWNQGWVKNAPVLLAAMADDKFRKNKKPNHWAEFDTGAASLNIYLQSVNLGLMAHPMAGFDEDKLSEVFNIPDNFSPKAMIAIGYQAEPEILDDDYRESETEERFRRPLGSTFFDSEWEKPII